MAKFQNITTGDKGLYSVDGLVMVPAGGVFDGELAKGEEPSEEWFVPAKAEAKAPAKADDAK